MATELYSSPFKVRELLNLEPDDAPDSRIEPYLDRAWREVIRDLTGVITDEKLIGTIDGANTSFSTPIFPIADRDGSKTITSTDIDVFSWVTDANGVLVRTTVTVSSVTIISARDGYIKISPAPVGTIEKLTADYRFAVFTQDTASIDDLVTYKAGYLFAWSELLFLPKGYRIGSISIKEMPTLDMIQAKYDIKLQEVTESGHVFGIRERLFKHPLEVPTVLPDDLFL